MVACDTELSLPWPRRPGDHCAGEFSMSSSIGQACFSQETQRIERIGVCCWYLVGTYSLLGVCQLILMPEMKVRNSLVAARDAVECDAAECIDMEDTKPMLGQSEYQERAGAAYCCC